MPLRYVRLERESHVATVTLDRPEKLNAFNDQMSSEIWSAMHEVDMDPEVRAVVLAGNGRSFCAGADLIETENPDLEHRGPYWRPMAGGTLYGAWELSKPLVGAIQGHCVAGGLELAAFCDIRVAAADARFGCPENRWNLPDGYLAALLPRMMHRASDAMRILLTGQLIDAAEALRCGLVSRVLPDREGALSEAVSIARAIAANGPVAVQMTKQLTLAGRYPIDDTMRLWHEYQRLAMAMEDAREGNAAWRERRAPAYQGR